ncbi:hypothetical protein SAY87_019018 [Trapa incisa]|uniref:Protein ECERIFERUM 3 n=1 Tax=Trapa incisa TaxID=236973 RepID=A0AAN7K420_9MYRT|nr:hypothetical protein SAY87_019018 [Trapa incisa]
MVTPLSAWTWENLGAYKYLLYGPLVAQAVYTVIIDGESKGKSYFWGLHLLILWTIRYFIFSLSSSLANMLFINHGRRINHEGVDFKQIDLEWDWDNFLILQALMASIAYYTFPSLQGLPLWNTGGLITALVLHMGVSEPLYYWIHRCTHAQQALFRDYHSLHHGSPVPQPSTAGNATFLEHLILTAVMGVPMLGPCLLLKNGSLGLIYCYITTFDSLRCLGHCNIEVIPHQLFQAFPFLRHLIYTPTYHSLHHTEMNTNFCLFMPLYDAVGNTLNARSWLLHKQISSKSGCHEERAPDLVFLAHVVDFSSSMHAPFVWRSFASKPFTVRFFQIPCLPFAFGMMLAMWAWGKTFTNSFYNFRGRLHHTWVVPRFGFQYFLQFAAEGINQQIEEAILKADRLGVKVVSLAALNKVGNEVLLTGATSKLGRAIALYLCRKRVRVLMLTQSVERFQEVQKEAPLDCQGYLVQVTKYQSARNCKASHFFPSKSTGCPLKQTWIIGKLTAPEEQNWAPAGTHFHQFVVPPIAPFRKDCTYGGLAGMRLPADVEGLGCCEYTMDRGVVHACHAGGVVHLLEGWTHHEVGPVDIDRIDLVWEVAIRHGLRPVSG